MGLLRLVFWAFVGPLIFWLALWGHVIYQVGFVEPQPIKMTSWPAGTDEALKTSIINQRKEILKDFKEMLPSGDLKLIKNFVDNRVTDDIVWEDPMEKYIGKSEFTDLMSLSKYVQNIEYNTHGEHHAPHEMLVDWTLKIYLTFLPSYPFSLRMRTHFLLEPSDKVGSPEKLFKIFEEWNGNVHLNEKTVNPPVLGVVHQHLRRSVGMAASWTVQKGLI